MCQTVLQDTVPYTVFTKIPKSHKSFKNQIIWATVSYKVDIQTNFIWDLQKIEHQSKNAFFLFGRKKILV